MADVYCYSYVEDRPSADIARKLLEHRNATKTSKLLFNDGFPEITGGYSRIEEKADIFLNMARAGIYTFIITDLDNRKCAGMMLREWFSIPTPQPISLPKEVVFRIAVREAESWILADRETWAKYIKIPVANWSRSPDQLADPKQHLLNVVRNKGRKKVHKEMLPHGTAHIGPRYNDVLCEFIAQRWSPTRAAALSPSLKRAIDALGRL